MNMKNIQCVMTILSEGSITGASKKLFLSQPALSQRIKLIEQDLGAPIFDRSTEPISLTYAGRKYVEAAQQVLDIDRNLRAQIAESKHEMRGRIRVGISVQRGLQLLPLVVPEFTRQYPHIRLELIEQGSAMLERMISEGQCDLALVATNEKPNKLNYVLIENEQVVLMAARSTQLAHHIPDGTPIEISEAQNEKFVSMKSGHSVRLVQDRLFTLHHINPQILMETSNMEAGKNVAARANAVMLIPQVYVSNSLDLHYRVQCYPILNSDFNRHFYLCYRKGMYLTRYMLDFVRIVCDKLGVPLNMPNNSAPKIKTPSA